MEPTYDGELRHFEALIRQHQPQLHGFARRLCRQGGVEPEDLVQDTLERALRRREWLAAQNERMRLAWLYTTLRRRFLDLRRHQRVEELVGATLELIEAPVLIRQKRQWLLWERVSDEQLREAFEHLKPSLREPLELHALGLRYKDIAQRVGATVGTVGGRIFQARQVLRARLVARLSDEEPQEMAGSPS
ncbi:RNA polymerase sigma factor [Hyalangium rubrum]|uniref:RNA polymerase sigma factor n=1 Tax=Hyalangium rubrum TaxID=3103134 RepID=A0ABU5HEB7_9BACT|nr:RNA polymerase sigma factor [Hyalangium sp. s54d21]MDY7231487.1 RNA polymerase sigma factor [Hyalangium sp. s54d21]